MYIYSILLHFACVKYPHPVFHQMCNTLSNKNQLAIASFFENLVKTEKIDRRVLGKAISDSSPKSPIHFLQMGSPIKTPNSKVFKTSSPNEHQTRILNSLKLQLDTEQYERGVMEVQMKQYEEKILKLEKSQKTFSTTIEGLKNELIFAKNTENVSPNRNVKGEQIIKRLRKELAEKEEKIYKLKGSIDGLAESKKSTDEKVSFWKD